MASLLQASLLQASLALLALRYPRVLVSKYTIACVLALSTLNPTIQIFPPGFRREGSAPSGTFSGIQHLGPDPCWNPPKGRLYGNGRPSLPGVHRSGAFRSASPHPPGKKSLS